MPRVSVIIPAFNAEQFIAETLASVDAQTYGDWEVVVGDDGSTDGTADVVRAFGDRALARPEPDNSGPAEARNRAIAHASGELLAFLDADDLWLPDYLDVAGGAVRRDAGVRGERRDRRLQRAHPGGGRIPPGDIRRSLRAERGLTLSRLLGSNPIFVSALAPRAVVDEAGGFCTEIVGTEDYDLWVRILELGYQVVASSSRSPSTACARDRSRPGRAAMARATATRLRPGTRPRKLSAREAGSHDASFGCSGRSRRSPQRRGPSPGVR